MDFAGLWVRRFAGIKFFTKIRNFSLTLRNCSYSLFVVKLETDI